MKIELIRKGNGWISVVINGIFIQNVRMTEKEFYEYIKLELSELERNGQRIVYKNNIKRGD